MPSNCNYGRKGTVLFYCTKNVKTHDPSCQLPITDCRLDYSDDRYLPWKSERIFRSMRIISQSSTVRWCERRYSEYSMKGSKSSCFPSSPCLFAIFCTYPIKHNSCQSTFAIGTLKPITSPTRSWFNAQNQPLSYVYSVQALPVWWKYGVLRGKEEHALHNG